MQSLVFSLVRNKIQVQLHAKMDNTEYSKGQIIAAVTEYLRIIENNRYSKGNSEIFSNKRIAIFLA